MSSSNKPKLKLEGKRTLLEQALHWTIRYESSDNKKTLPFFKFIKMIAVNNAFLAISRAQSFDIYRLSFKESAYSEKIFLLYFESKSYKISSELSIRLPFDQCYSLFKFLRFLHVGTCLRNISELKQMTKLLQPTNGKLGLSVHPIGPSIIEFIETNASRVHELECRAILLVGNGMFSFGTLDRLVVWRVEGFDDFKFIFRYNVKSLELNINYYFNGDKKTYKLSNTAVKHLSLNCGYQYYDAFERASDYLINCCPNLLELNIDVTIGDKVAIDQLSSLTSKYFEYMQGLKNTMSDNAKIAVKFRHQISYDWREYDQNAVKSTFGKINFDGWKKTQEIHSKDHDELQLESKNGGNFCVQLKIYNS